MFSAGVLVFLSRRLPRANGHVVTVRLCSLLSSFLIGSLYNRELYHFFKPILAISPPRPCFLPHFYKFFHFPLAFSYLLCYN